MQLYMHQLHRVSMHFNWFYYWKRRSLGVSLSVCANAQSRLIIIYDRMTHIDSNTFIAWDYVTDARNLRLFCADKWLQSVGRHRKSHGKNISQTVLAYSSSALPLVRTCIVCVRVWTNVIPFGRMAVWPTFVSLMKKSIHEQHIKWFSGGCRQIPVDMHGKSVFQASYFVYKIFKIVYFSLYSYNQTYRLSGLVGNDSQGPGFETQFLLMIIHRKDTTHRKKYSPPKVIFFSSYGHTTHYF